MRIALLSLFALVAFTSCTKTVNHVETVNQAFSAVYNITPDKWTQSTDANGFTFYYATLPISELTQSIDQNGGVEVYLTFDDPTTNLNPTYETLPEVVGGIAYGSLHTTGTVTIDLRSADGASSLTSAISTNVSVKVVLIDAAPLD